MYIEELTNKFFEYFNFTINSGIFNNKFKMNENFAIKGFN